MSVLLTSALLATVAAAQLTTSIWMPGAANTNQSFVGSVVALQNDRTTISMAFDGDAIETEYYGQGPDLVTLGGTTYVAYEATAIDEDSTVTVTVNFACSRADGSAVPTCTVGSQIDGAAANTISGLESGFESAQTTTTTLSGDEQYFLNNFKLVITAGTEKLSASAAATPTASGPSPTGSSAKSSAASAASAASSAGSSGVAQATGAAAPMRSLAPVLAGMGAAAAFFL